MGVLASASSRALMTELRWALRWRLRLALPASTWSLGVKWLSAPGASWGTYPAAGLAFAAISRAGNVGSVSQAGQAGCGGPTRVGHAVQLDRLLHGHPPVGP